VVDSTLQIVHLHHLFKDVRVEEGLNLANIAVESLFQINVAVHVHFLVIKLLELDVVRKKHTTLEFGGRATTFDTKLL
jgi:hypothetical protein